MSKQCAIIYMIILGLMPRMLSASDQTPKASKTDSIKKMLDNNYVKGAGLVAASYFVYKYGIDLAREGYAFFKQRSIPTPLTPKPKSTSFLGDALDASQGSIKEKKENEVKRTLSIVASLQPSTNNGAQASAMAQPSVPLTYEQSAAQFEEEIEKQRLHPIPARLIYTLEYLKTHPEEAMPKRKRK